jgi:energy-coupling factor transport system permease protein
LPDNWPLIGGTVTLEAAVYGFLNGLRLVTLLSFFMAFNAVVPVARLTSLTPGALHELGLVVLIAITYVPETLQQFKRIREAQAIRGHRLDGIRAWRPMIVPLLITGLERALNLAETMVSRGYGSTTSVAVPLYTRLLFAGGLLLILIGALLSAWGRTIGLFALAAGGGAVVWAYRTVSRDHVRTRYRPRPWTGLDTLVVAGAALPLMLLFLPGFERSQWAYSPYPSLSWPSFNILIGLSLLGLALPVLLGQISPSVEVRP